MYYIGVDVGGTTIKGGLVDGDGRLIEQSRIATVTDNWSIFLSNLTAFIRIFQQKAAVEAVGIGIPGLINVHSRTVITSPNIPCLTNASVENSVADEVHIPVVSENDANAAAYSEFTMGFGVGLKHMAYLTIGTGLGSGIVLDGKLFTGTSGYAVEFGHSVIDPGGRPCPCGSIGCLETLVSAPGIHLTALEVMKEYPDSALHGAPKPLTSEMIFNVALTGDRAAIETFSRTGRWLGLACGNLMNMLNLQVIALGGGVMAAGELLLPVVIETARRYSFATSFEDCRIVQSKSWPDAGIIGAAMLARDRNN